MLICISFAFLEIQYGFEEEKYECGVEILQAKQIAKFYHKLCQIFNCGELNLT